MAHAPNNIVKPYTEVQKSPDIPNEEEHENMVSVLYVGFYFAKQSFVCFHGRGRVRGCMPVMCVVLYALLAL